jgi:hypothetical protein
MVIYAVSRVGYSCLRMTGHHYTDRYFIISKLEAVVASNPGRFSTVLVYHTGALIVSILAYYSKYGRSSPVITNVNVSIKILMRFRE